MSRCNPVWSGPVMVEGMEGLWRSPLVGLTYPFVPEPGYVVCGSILAKPLVSAMDGSNCKPLSLEESLQEAYPIDNPFLSGSRWRCILLAYQLYEDVHRIWLVELEEQGFPTPYHLSPWDKTFVS